ARPRDDERAGVAAGAEGRAVDHHLVGVADDELLALAAASLILHVDVGVDRADRAGLAAGGPAALGDRQPDPRGPGCGAGHAAVQDLAAGVHLTRAQLRQGGVRVLGAEWNRRADVG